MYRKLRYLYIYIFSFIYRYWLILIGVKVGKRNLFLGRLEIRGNPKSIIIGDNSVFQRYVCLNSTLYNSCYGTISVGSNCLIGDGSILSSSSLIKIEDGVEIAANTYIVDHDHNTAFSDNEPQKIIIHKNVWLGTSVTILKGVTIGSNSVVGANSLVSKEIPEGSLVVGNPFKILKRIEINE